MVGPIGLVTHEEARGGGVFFNATWLNRQVFMRNQSAFISDPLEAGYRGEGGQPLIIAVKILRRTINFSCRKLALSHCLAHFAGNSINICAAFNVCQDGGRGAGYGDGECPSRGGLFCANMGWKIEKFH